MRRLLRTLVALLLLLGGLTACTSSGGKSSTPSCDARCRSNIIAACAGSCAPNPSDPPALHSAEASALPQSAAATGLDTEPGAPGDDVDLNTCAAWNAANDDSRTVGASYFAQLYNAPDQSDGFVLSLNQAITTACASYPEDRVARVVADIAVITPQDLPGPS